MPEKQTPAAPEEMVRVYSRFTQRTLIHGEYRAVPNSFATVPRAVAAIWMERYPDDIVESGVAQKELNGVSVELAETKTKLLAAETRIKELEAQLTGKPLKPVKTGIGGKPSDAI